MKILFVCGNLCNGGAQRVVSIVASYLAEKGYNVSLLIFSRNEKEYPISPKVKLTSLGKSYEEYSAIPMISRIRLIRRFLKGLQPDIVVGFLEGGYALQLASSDMKYKRVASARINPKYILADRGIRAAINRLWFHCADAIVLQTESQLELAPPDWRKKSLIIANPISENALEKCCESYHEKCRNLIMVGRLEKQKNYPMAFAAIKIVKEKYPDIHLDVFGKGVLEKPLKDMIEQMGLSENITMHGWTQNALEEYTKHDMYIMTSDYEGMPNALMEAMAVGLPCISTDCETGPADLIHNGENGYLVPVNHVEKLAEKIICFIEMPFEERKRIAKNAHVTLKEKYNVEVICQKWEQMFNNLVKE